MFSFLSFYVFSSFFPAFPSRHRIMTSDKLLLLLSSFGECDASEFIGLHVSCLGVKSFQSTPLDGDGNWIYET